MEEAEWAVQVLKTTKKPVAATLCIGPEGDLNGVSPGDCAVKLVKAGMYVASQTKCCHTNILFMTSWWHVLLEKFCLKKKKRKDWHPPVAG